jgi:peptidoglycan/xylan/chitin deacetylase (PgdA/CDA1 family)
MNKVRRFYIPIAFAFALGLAGYAVWPREPVYQGRDLSAWLRELVELEGQAPTVEEVDSARPAWEVRHDKAVTAIRSIGTKALPHLLRWLRSAPGPTPVRDKLEELLDKQSLVNIKLLRRPDHRYQAILGFRELGSAGEPALSKLRGLLRKPITCEGAVFALGAIGQAAVPILASELTNSNCPVQNYVVSVLMDMAPSVGPTIVPVLVDGVTNPGCHVPAECLTGLGNLGPLSREVAPWLGALAREPGHPLAGLAMRVVAEVSATPEQYLSLFSDRLNDTNWAGHAAFALARLGFDGVPPLLRALTNQEPIIYSAALAALNPKLRERRLSSGATSPAHRLSALSSIFDADANRWSQTPPATSRIIALQGFAVPIRLESLLDHPDAAVRLQIVQLLARYGHNSAIGLSRAAADINESVRVAAKADLAAVGIEARDGGIIRGPADQRRIALIFAGHEYAEGGETILNELARHKAQASFFLTRRFLSHSDFDPLVRRLYQEGHYLGPHSTKHLVYCSVDEPKQTLVTREQFDADFTDALNSVHRIDASIKLPGYFLPPDERHNLEIAEWASNYFFATIGYTPGTRSTADCTGEADPDFVSSKAIFDSIVAKEQQDPHGLNGCLLLLHIGSGPGRADKFHARLGELLDYLTGKGYQFVAVDELFDPKAAAERRRLVAATISDPTTNPDAAALERFRQRYGRRYGLEH